MMMMMMLCLSGSEEAERVTEKTTAMQSSSRGKDKEV
jgi:hypothetical protein